MASVRILYWKEIPVQIETHDETEKISTPLDPKFQEAVDTIAMFDKSYGTDEYLDAWEWGNSYELKGSECLIIGPDQIQKKKYLSPNIKVNNHLTENDAIEETKRLKNTFNKRKRKT